MYLCRDRVLYLLPAGILILFFITLISLDKHGRNSRTEGIGYPLNAPQIIKITVGYPEQAYNLWKEKGFKGRIVISLGRRLNFVEPVELSSVPAMTFPLKISNISKVVEDNLKAENFLLVSMETGLAREIIHIVPENLLFEKMEFAGKEEGVFISKEKIEAPFFGSPRTITTLSSLKSPVEPALLYVNASIFKEIEPEELLGQLVKTGLKTDLVVLCRSYDDKEVTDRERESLKVFDMLLGGLGGRQ